VSTRFTCPPGYRVERIPGSHDGVGNVMVRAYLGDSAIAGSSCSIDARSWLDGFMAGHEAARR
jgi:hypothetical protein